MMQDGDEKLRAPREPVTLFVEYEGADDLVGDFTDNLSSGGTFVTTNRSLPVGTQVQLVLSFPGLIEPISIEGTVRWPRGDNAGGGNEMKWWSQSSATFQRSMSSNFLGPISTLRTCSCSHLEHSNVRISKRLKRSLKRYSRSRIVQENVWM